MRGRPRIPKPIPEPRPEQETAPAGTAEEPAPTGAAEGVDVIEEPLPLVAPAGDIIPAPASAEGPAASPPAARRPDRIRQPVSIRRWILLTIVLGFLGGGPGLLLAAAVGIVGALLSPTPRSILRAALAAMVLVPVVVLVRGLPPAFFVSPDFVGRDLAAHYLAAAALVLLVIGILRDRGAPAPEFGVAVPAAPAEVPVAEPEPAPLTVPPAVRPRRSLLRRVGRRLRHRISRIRLPLPRLSGFWAALAGLAAVDVALRYGVGGSASPDAITARLGADLAAGSGFSLPGPLGGLAPTALRSPLVPTLIGLAQTSVAPAFVLRLVWALVGGGTVVATGLAGRRLFSPPIGLLAAALVALLPTFWFENVRLESAPPAQLLVALMLFTAATARKDPAAGFSVRRAFLLGVLGGLLALSRPEGVLLAAAIVLAWIFGRRASDPNGHRRAVVAITAIISLTAVAGPWFGRNWSEFRTAWPVTEVGRIAAGSNAPSAYSGAFAGSFDPAAAGSAVKVVAANPLAEGALDRALISHAADYAIHHPGGLIGALAIRALRTFELWSPSNEQAVHASRGLSTRGWKLQWLSFLVLLGLAVIGYASLWPRRTWEAAPLFVVPIAALAVGILAYGDPLARSAIDPALALVAAVGTTRIPRVWRWLRSRKRPRLRLPRLRRRSPQARQGVVSGVAVGEMLQPTQHRRRLRIPRLRLRLRRPRLPKFLRPRLPKFRRPGHRGRRPHR